MGICASIRASTSFGTEATMSVYIASGDGIDRDPLGCCFERQRFREAENAGLRSGVVRLPELALLAVDRRNVDDAPEPHSRIEAIT